ncbi:MAG: hypothetical protein LLG14_00890 [Nocardiaceae bacterium]|nr:hypothetical protein [Nocardiaceae bacterium]
MQSQSQRHALRRIRHIALAAPICAAIFVGISAPATAVVTPGPVTPTTATKVEPLPVPPANILPLALPLILTHDARVARDEQNASKPKAQHRTIVPLTLSETFSPPAIALAGLGVVTLAGGTAFAAVARRRT